MSRRPRQTPPLSATGTAPSAHSSAGRIFLLALLLLAGLLVMTLFGRLLLERRLALAPTPTLTRAPANTDTPTPDFRATINIAEIITQNAYRAAQIGINTPTPDNTVTPTATETPLEEPTSTPTRIITVLAPGIGGVPGAETPTSTETPTPDDGGIEIDTPTPLPGQATQTAEAGATATALLFTPTFTATPVPTATPTSPVAGAPPVATLQAVVKRVVDVYAGPSVLYPFKTQLPQNLTVRLEGRTPSGEWVHVCCVNNVDGWARQAFFEITGNKAPAGAPPDAKDNDVRWLALQESNAVPLTPLPTPTEMPVANYPLFRRDAAGTGRVNTQFRTPISYGWPPDNRATAGGGFSSPPVVVGASVIAASLDSQLYSFDRAQGNQRWRIKLNAVVEQSPAVQDPYIYVVDQQGEVSALRDTGNPADAFVWRRDLNIPPSAPINIRGDILFVPGSDHILYALHRLDNGRNRWLFAAPETPESRLQYPAIGDQMIYVGDARLSAVDVYSGTEVWSDPAVNRVVAPPVYARPGVNGLAEVYAVDAAGVIHALDANTGAAFWRKGSGDLPTALAVDERAVYAAGPGFVAARDRRTGDQLWRINFSDIGILGGPIVGNGRLLVAGVSGSVQILDAVSGLIVGAAPINETLAGAPAVSEGWIFLSARNGRLYAMRESN